MGCCYSMTQPHDGNQPKPSVWKPFKKRSCTDVIPLIVFTLFCVGMIVVTVFAVLTGAADRLIYGFDSYGNICGKVNKDLTHISNSGKDLRGKSFVFFMEITDPKGSLEICVSQCPDQDMLTMKDVSDFYERTGSQLCDYNVDPGDYRSGRYQNTKVGPCPTLPIKKSSPIVFRCVPDNIPEVISTFISFINNSVDTLSKILSDIYLCRYAIIGLSFLSVAVSFIIVLMIRFMASIVVYVINILVVVAAIAGTGLMWWTYIAAEYNLSLKPFDVTFITEIDNKETFLWYSIAATVLSFVLICLVICMRKRVALTVDLFYEAGKCLQHIPLLLMQPIWTFIVLVLFWICWIGVFGFLATAGQPEVENQLGWVTYNQTGYVRYMWWYHVVGLFWISEFILACQQIVIAGAVAKYYFTRDKKTLSTPILSSMTRLLANHIGSAALGSFVIILVKIPRCMLMYLYRQIKDNENVVAKMLVKCCICCLWVLEKCLRYLNYNAYSLVAINGTNFCKSACDAVATLLSNSLRVIAINTIGVFVLFLGKILVTVIVGAIGGVFVMWYHPHVQYVAAPVAVIMLFSFLTAHCFLSVYDMAVDTLLLCFCEDYRVNDGTAGNEYFMSKSLLAYVKNSSKTLDLLDGKKTKKGEEAEALRHESSI